MSTEVDPWDGIEFEHESEKEWTEFLGRNKWMPKILEIVQESLKEPRKLEGAEKEAYKQFLDNQIDGVHSEMTFIDWSPMLEEKESDHE